VNECGERCKLVMGLSVTLILANADDTEVCIVFHIKIELVYQCQNLFDLYRKFSVHLSTLTKGKNTEYCMSGLDLDY